MRSTVLLALAALAVGQLFCLVTSDDPTVDLQFTDGVANEPETADVDDLATQALPAMYRSDGWRFHKNKKCSYKWKKARFCPPPPSPPYCCGGSKCRHHVPEPPLGLPANAVKSNRVTYTRRATHFSVPDNVLKGPVNQTVHDLALCENTRKPVQLPWTGANEATALINMYFQDDTNPKCPLNNGAAICTGQVIAPYMVLLATHCVSTSEEGDPGCGSATLRKVTVCLNYNPQGNSPSGTAPVRECPADGLNGVITRDSLGVSYNTKWKKPGDAYDYAIIFLSAPIYLPTYFKYNYVENTNPDAPKNVWWSRSFTGEGSAGTATERGRCGCQTCPDVTCNLAVSGPYIGPVPLQRYDSTDVTEVPAFFNAPLSSCGGSSGSCLTVNEDTCCVGINSYEIPQDPVCAFNCAANFWSAISLQLPLTDLWSSVQMPL